MGANAQRKFYLLCFHCCSGASSNNSNAYKLGRLHQALAQRHRRRDVEQQQLARAAAGGAKDEGAEGQRQRARIDAVLRAVEGEPERWN